MMIYFKPSIHSHQKTADAINWIYDNIDRYGWAVEWASTKKRNIDSDFVSRYKYAIRINLKKNYELSCNLSDHDTLFYITSERSIDRILRKGIMPLKENKRRIYVSTSIEEHTNGSILIAINNRCLPKNIRFYRESVYNSIYSYHYIPKQYLKVIAQQLKSAS